jgi:uncharacterized protein YPO0396
VIEDLQRQLDEAERAKPERLRKRELARAACEVMGWAMPDEVVWFVQRAEAAREHIRKSTERADEAETRKDELKRSKVEAEKAFAEVVREVRAMERQRSNIPSRLLDLRSRMAQALGLSEERLPFAGEVLQVKADQAGWQGAIERVLGGFARSILVDDKHYAAVSSWLEEQNTGERLFYHRMLPQQSGNRSLGAWAAEICRVKAFDRLPAQRIGFVGSAASCGRGGAQRALRMPLGHAFGVDFAHLATLTLSSGCPCAANSAPSTRA